MYPIPVMYFPVSLAYQMLLTVILIAVGLTAILGLYRGAKFIVEVIAIIFFDYYMLLSCKPDDDTGFFSGFFTGMVLLAAANNLLKGSTDKKVRAAGYLSGALGLIILLFTPLIANGLFL